jgi:hypothetical protein
LPKLKLKLKPKLDKSTLKAYCNNENLRFGDRLWGRVELIEDNLLEQKGFLDLVRAKANAVREESKELEENLERLGVGNGEPLNTAAIPVQAAQMAKLAVVRLVDIAAIREVDEQEIRQGLRTELIEIFKCPNLPVCVSQFSVLKFLTFTFACFKTFIVALIELSARGFRTWFLNRIIMGLMWDVFSRRMWTFSKC